MVSRPVIGVGSLARGLLLSATALIPPALMLRSFGTTQAAALALYMGGLLLCHRTLMRQFSAGSAFWSVVLLAQASPLVWHASAASLEPLAAFVLGAACLELALDTRRGPARALVLGSLLGTVARLAGASALPLALLGGIGPRRSPRERGLWAAAFGLFWWALPGLPPAGLPSWPALHHLSDGWFSSRHGLLFWTPLAWSALISPLALNRSWPGMAAPLGAAFWLTCLLAGAEAYLGPGGHGGAAFCAALPLLAPGLAALLHALLGLASRRPGRVLAASFVLVVAWNHLLMLQQWRGMIPRDDLISFARVAGNSARLVSAAVGTPLAWPANWAFAAQHSLSPARYDGSVGRFLFGGGQPFGGVIDVGAGRPLEEWLLIEGWSVRGPCGEWRCRAIEGRARVLVPVDRPQGLELTLVGEGDGALALRLNGREAGRWDLREPRDSQRVLIGAALWKHGLNELQLEPDPGVRARVARLEFRPDAD